MSEKPKPSKPDEIFAVRARELARTAANAIEEAMQYADDIRDDELRDSVQSEIYGIIENMT